MQRGIDGCRYRLTRVDDFNDVIAAARDDTDLLDILLFGLDADAQHRWADQSLP
jgi:hypothetical protein